ncbi:hypothetical protein SODG_005771 [Sodalis praecaptivus]
MLIFTPVGELLLLRFESLSNESGLRISIWHHVLTEVSLHPWFGLGFNHELNFINYDGTHISTAHSVYLGTLYKGALSAWRCWRCCWASACAARCAPIDRNIAWTRRCICSCCCLSPRRACL